jgi:predicted RNA-binding Zn-ribbon protein involved in translation (DUF1610 family)
MPEPIRKWADKKGLQKLVKKYGWSFCEVCGRIGIRYDTEWIPVGINLEFTTQYGGWMHPPADGMKWGYPTVDFSRTWALEEKPEELDDRDLSYFFNLFMKSLNNSWGLGTEHRHGKGVTNPWDFCFSAKGPLGHGKERTREMCPKCGNPGTGESVVKEEIRFFHGPDRSCYLGMANPKRIKRVETICPKCGELGRESISKGYRYFRHQRGTCYVGKVSNESVLQHSGTVRKEGPNSNETTMLYTEPSENTRNEVT